MSRRTEDRRQERGQVLVIVALGMVVLIAMVGLVLDGGATFGQRRSEQRGADLAALAGANDLLLHGNVFTAQSVAESVATDNGYDPAVVSVAVTVNKYQSAGGTVKVDITAPHRNSFSAIMGFNSWNVSASATAVTGFVTGGTGLGPIIFSVNDFQPNGEPKPGYTETGCPAAPVSPPQNACPFGTVNGDAPAVGGNDLAWTNYGAGNVDTNQVANIIKGSEVIGRDLSTNDYIGQFNNGFPTTPCSGRPAVPRRQGTSSCPSRPNVARHPRRAGLLRSTGGAPAGGGRFQGWAASSTSCGGRWQRQGYLRLFRSGVRAGRHGRVTAALPPSFGNNYGLYLSE
jgi:Flp pilus assembly protein TadG